MDRGEGLHDAGFHILRAGSIKFSIGFADRIRFDRADVVNGVYVAQNEEAARAFAPTPDNVIACFGLFFDLYFGVQSAQLADDDRPVTFHSRFVGGRRFGFDMLGEMGDELGGAFSEIGNGGGGHESSRWINLDKLRLILPAMFGYT